MIPVSHLYTGLKSVVVVVNNVVVEVVDVDAVVVVIADEVVARLQS